jgi:hypothetical protein
MKAVEQAFPDLHLVVAQNRLSLLEISMLAHPVSPRARVSACVTVGVQRSTSFDVSTPEMANKHPVNVATRVDDLWAGSYAPVLPLSEDIFHFAGASATQVGHTPFGG